MYRRSFCRPTTLFICLSWQSPFNLLLAPVLPLIFGGYSTWEVNRGQPAGGQHLIAGALNISPQNYPRLAMRHSFSALEF